MTYRPVMDVWTLARCKYKGGAQRYGGYPGGFLKRARALLGVHIDDPVLHVCGGLVRQYPYRRAIGPNDRTLDLDPAVQPDYLQDARDPYPIGFAAVLADPPYTEPDADRYSPGAAALPSLIVKLAINALLPGQRVGMILHYLWPAPPAGSKEIAGVAVGCGRNSRARWFTVIEKGAA